MVKGPRICFGTSKMFFFLFPALLTMNLFETYFTSALESSGENSKVICYFTNWASKRPKYGKLLPSDLDPFLCSNIVYAFAFLNSTTLELEPSDPSVDLDQNFYKQVTSLASNHTKVLISLGGASDIKGTKYSEILNSQENRTRFINSSIKFLEEHNFQGLDIDIEFPVCPRGDCKAGNPKDREGFAALIKELHAEFKPRGWVLSAAISALSGIIDAAYDINALNEYLDWIGIMTYDYHSYRDGMTGSNAPLYSKPGDPSPDKNIDETVRHLLKVGALASKLVIGLPFYSRTFTLTDKTQHGYWAPTKGPGLKGPVTLATGILAYYEVCDFIKNGNWTEVGDVESGSYMFNGNQWASFLSMNDIERRINYLKGKKLGGVMIWELSFDDVHGMFCDHGKYPLLIQVNKLLERNYTSFSERRV